MATHKPVEVNELYGELTLAEPERDWWVVYTKPRCEKKLADFSFKKGISYYLPLKKSVKKYQYREITFTKPLFPGYIFVKCNALEKRELLIAGYIANFLKVDNEAELIEQLQQIRKGSEMGVDFRMVDFIAAGTKVEIIKGPFVGLTGVVKDYKNVKEILMQINILRKSVAVSATAEQIRKI